MLHAIELENFKAFGERARIPFAPITLIFGENSAGKSTILQALYLLKQTRESRDTGSPILPRADNGFVDLGSFQEMLFDHDLKRTLSICVETTMNKSYAISQLPYKEDTITIEFCFKCPSIEEKILLEGIKLEFMIRNPPDALPSFSHCGQRNSLKNFGQEWVSRFLYYMIYHCPRS